MTDENNRLQGTVVFWNGNSFGFIKPDSGDQDLLFHVTELPTDQSVHVQWRPDWGWVNVCEYPAIIVTVVGVVAAAGTGQLNPPPADIGKKRHRSSGGKKSERPTSCVLV
jgi:hypothetical protein